MNYILIDATTRKPVPLPFEVQEADGSPVTVYNYREPESGNILADGILETSTGLRLPFALGLAIITEAEFMDESERKRLEAEWEFFSDNSGL